MTLDEVEVECTHCGVEMSTHLGSSSKVRYFHCPSCHRWVSSTYAAEAFRSDSKVRAHERGTIAARKTTFEQVKERLERWLAVLDDQDPYRILGVSPLDPAERVRERYRELARTAHPDRGGSVERMGQLNDAYDRVLKHRERKAQEQLAAGRQSVTVHELPQAT